MRIINDKIFTTAKDKGNDAITCYGPDTTLINRCIFDFRSIPLSEQDEIVSGVNGPKVTIRNSLFLGGIKALLAGNGDHLINDSATARWGLENCVIIGSGRRCAEAQATNESFGVVKGTADRKGGIYVETNGEMSLNGWDELEAHTQSIFLTEEDFAASEDPEGSGLYPSFVGRMVVIQS